MESTIPCASEYTLELQQIVTYFVHIETRCVQFRYGDLAINIPSQNRKCCQQVLTATTLESEHLERWDIADVLLLRQFLSCTNRKRQRSNNSPRLSKRPIGVKLASFYLHYDLSKGPLDSTKYVYRVALYQRLLNADRKFLQGKQNLELRSVSRFHGKCGGAGLYLIEILEQFLPILECLNVEKSKLS